MNNKSAALKAAFPHTLPVLAGFLFLGAAYGILMNGIGAPPLLTLLMSTFVFAGSPQYVAVTLLAGAFAPMLALLMTLVINARHLFYGISMLDRFRDTGKCRFYLIFAMCDETFSVLNSAKPPEGTDRTAFMFFIALLDHLYWIAGSMVGALLGAFLPSEGMDFVLTALFVSVFAAQWERRAARIPELIGVAVSVLCLFIFGDAFILPAMAMMLLTLLPLRGRLYGGDAL